MKLLLRRIVPAPMLEARRRRLVRKRYRYWSSLDPADYPRALEEWYLQRTGRRLDLDDPRTYDEKIQWMKLYDATPLKGRLSDKYLVRDWVAERVGSQHLVPLLGVWDGPADIDFDALPGSFVLKATHGCGFNIIVPDKTRFDAAQAVRQLDEWLGLDFAYMEALELQYHYCEPRVVAEQYLENSPGDLYDYKFFCFDGRVACVGFVRNRAMAPEEACFDRDWQPLPCTYCGHPRIAGDLPRPAGFDEAVQVAEALAKGFPHVRVDLYLPGDGSVLFGEMTFTTLSGISQWDPESCNLEFGKLIDLRQLPAWQQMHGR